MSGSTLAFCSVPLAGILGVLGGCSGSAPDPQTDPDVDAGGPDASAPDASGPPTGCAYDVSLVNGEAYPVRVGPAAVDPTGIGVCIHLDGTASPRSVFEAESDRESGAASSFELTLFGAGAGAGDTSLAEGWDVTFGDPPHVFASLGWEPWDASVPAEQRVMDVVLRVRTRDGGPATTSIGLGLFDPLE